ncbi:hypothetical protein SAMN05720354_1243 [Nitrosospira sp. Nsp1]|nr:hypothetical protein SAMN05720354_1243 [Nitrosospira sp. Nsp1]
MNRNIQLEYLEFHFLIPSYKQDYYQSLEVYMRIFYSLATERHCVLRQGQTKERLHLETENQPDQNIV